MRLDVLRPELDSELQMNRDELAIEIASASAKAMFSLSEKWEDREDDSSIEKVDVLEDRKATDPIGELHRRDMIHFLTRSLTHKERFIIEQHDHVGHTMREIGELLALTESRVCQNHSNEMDRLKGVLGQKSGTLLMEPVANERLSSVRDIGVHSSLMVGARTSVRPYLSFVRAC